ncbi:RNA polymerase sigma factor [Pseudomonas cavernae]|uniref:RNA polymerase sigma factor n=1 Tax=Pseudomonas cavernae TaxID=2320867 RepID=A0A385Z6Q7_9PSED|nr:RNA polymerase sigma factor [Pseudomonas cavernae]AYC33663.1 RNA polymerase sigma factor [Pseudomonas cavernae]
MQLDPLKPSLLAELVRHYDELVDQLRRRFGDRGFAHEVVHDVCVQLLEGPEKQAVRSPLALLRKIAHDVAINRYRSDTRRQAWIVSLPELPDTLCPAAAHDRQYAAQRDLERLVEAIAALPKRCQQVFVMHKIHELPHAEVAARLGISRKTVEKHLRLGLAACRAKLHFEEDRE